MTKRKILGFGFGRFIFVAASLPVLMASGLYTGQPWYEMLLSLFSVFFLMYLAEGKRIGCLLGIGFTLGHGTLFFSRAVYGLAAFNVFIAAPMYLFSFISWGRNQSKNDGAVVAMKKLSPKGWALTLGAGAVIFTGLFLLLRSTSSSGALLDSLSLAMVAPAIVLLYLRYIEQWILHLCGNFIAMLIWIVNTMDDFMNFNFVLIAALAVTVNAIGLVTWLKLMKAERSQK